jgi:hypothetical protein
MHTGEPPPLDLPRSDLEARVDARLDELGVISPDARDAGEALLAVAVELHTTALATLVERLHDAGGDAAVDAAAGDPRVGPILVLHDLHPGDLVSQVETALHGALTELGGSTPVGGALLGVDAGIARVSIADPSARSGCNGSSRADHVVRALLAGVPELDDVEVVAPMMRVPDDPVETLVALPRLRAVAPEAVAAPARLDACELCGTAVADGHGHGVDVEQHRLVCLCDPCRIVLGANRDGQGRFRALPDRVIADPEFARADGEWEALGIPVSTAFFFHDSVADGIVAFYPSPAGATESLLGAQQWGDLAGTSAVASELVPDTEAMLVRRSDHAHESYLVPVDRCYELVGLLRMHWRGFDGGQDAHDALDEFFGRIRAEARDAQPGAVVRA